MSGRLDQVAELIGGLTDAECRQVFEMCRRRMSALQQVKVATFRVGQTVSFEGRHGQVLTGRVKKLNQKTATVEVPNPAFPDLPQTWRVSPGLLRAAP